MRSNYRHIILLALVFCLLAGSVGMAATQRFCAMMGMPLPAASAEKVKEMGCCQKKKQAPCNGKAAVEKKTCCSTSTTYQNLEVLSLKTSDKAFSASLPPANNIHYLLPPPPALLFSSAWPICSDSSPPLAGRALLTRIHTLNI